MGVFGKRNQGNKQTVELDSILFKRISTLLSAHPGEDVSSKGIAHFNSGKSEKQFINVVGESFFQEDIKKNFKKDSWEYGLLVPEQDNKHDANAVAVYLINKKYEVVKVGYLEKDSAKRISKKLANLMINEGLVVPVLAIPKVSPEEPDNWGIRAYAMTDKINFL